MLRPFLNGFLCEEVPPEGGGNGGNGGNVPPAAPPITATPPAVDTNPPWMTGRIKEAKQAERNALLKEFGVESKEALAAKLKTLDELQTSQLTEQERSKKLIDDLTPKAAIADAAIKTLNEVIESQFNALPEQQRTAIDAKANGDAAKRWELMQFASALGVTAAAPGAPPAPKPASTTAAAPPPPPPGTTKTAFDTWNDLKKTDSIGASLFYQTNAQKIEQSRPAQQSA